MKTHPREPDTEYINHLLDVLHRSGPKNAPEPDSRQTADAFVLLGNRDLAHASKMPPQYLLGILMNQELCQIFVSDQPMMRRTFSYRVSDPKELPPQTLVQVMNPHWEGTRLVAQSVAYFTPGNGYSRMGWLGPLLPASRWRGPSPTQLLHHPIPPWPQLKPDPKYRDSMDRMPVLPEQPRPVFDSTPTMRPPIPPTQPDEDVMRHIEEKRRENLRKEPSVNSFLALIKENAASEPAPEHRQPGDLSPSLNKESLKLLYKINCSFYSPAAASELETLLESSASLNGKSLRRAQTMLRYAYTRKKKYTLSPIEALREKLAQALPGQQDVATLVLNQVELANRTRKPLTLLLLDEEDAAAREIRRCLCEVLPGAARLDANVGDLGLTGVDFSYDNAVPSQTIQKLDGPMLCIDSCEAVFWSADKNKDSAAPAFTSLLRERTFTDKFLNVPVHYYGHIVAQARVLDQSYRRLFAQVLEVPLRSRSDKMAVLQAKAKAHAPAFTLSSDAAAALLQRYAPGSLRRAFQYLDLLAGYAEEQGLAEVQPDDLTAALGTPCLTRDEELVSRLECRTEDLPAETAREAAHQAQILLAPDSPEQARDTARRMLDVLTGLLQAGVPAGLPSASRLRAALDGELLGLEGEKDLVVSVLHARKRKILFFCGAPGTGKTALARALAKASGRELVRIDMAALMPDLLTGRAAIHGIGGDAGILVRRIARAGKPCVVLLDEIDKAIEPVMNRLLELFENDHLFDDAFVGRVDLHRHLFLLSGNSLRITRPLLDRCQVVEMQPYTPAEKAALLQRKWLACLQEENLPCEPLGDKLVRQVVAQCASGGARDVENAVERLVRRIAAGRPLPRTEEDIHHLLGGSPLLPQPIHSPGTVYCLAALENGGGLVSPLQVAENPSGQRLQTLGMVDSATMRESCEMALAVAARLLDCTPPSLLITMDASRKDGPSGGAAIFLAVYSLMTGTVLGSIAATGELMLDGSILPVGGVPSKLIGAIRCAGLVHTVLLPAANRADVPDKLAAEAAAAGITLHYVATVQEALSVLPGKKPVSNARG